MTDQPAILVLEDGTTFAGLAFGAIGETFGEAVFATGMTGYQETLTDPSYHAQVVVATAPHIGNTGWNDQDGESGRIQVAGYVVRDPSPAPSNWRSTGRLDDELVRQGVVGIKGIDTRALTRRLREVGAMRVGVSSLTGASREALLAKVLASPPMAGADLVGAVTTQQAYDVPPVGEQRFQVAAIDLGIKTNITTLMARRGMALRVLPAGADMAQIVGLHPDGVFLSNGPGDPAAAGQTVALVRDVLAAGLPLFGICLGHQVFGRALGFDTYKLRFGHRGINQPVQDVATGHVDITAHNHGFAVDAPVGQAVATSLGEVRVSHVCLNDSVVEGLELVRGGKVVAFSVQYHPEAAAGPHDAEHLFNQFAALMTARRDGEVADA